MSEQSFSIKEIVGTKFYIVGYGDGTFDVIDKKECKELYGELLLLGEGQIDSEEKLSERVADIMEQPAEEDDFFSSGYERSETKGRGRFDAIGTE